MANPDEVALHFTEDWSGKRPPVKHRMTVFFHLFFRVFALLTYIFCGWFTNEFISPFVFILLLLCMDFWTVKNVTGRLLVGHRWWNYIDDEGKSHWIYESRETDDVNTVDPSEAQVFWLALVICPVIWFLLLFISLFRFNLSWFVVVVIALALNGANLHGYVRCKIGKEKFTVILSNLMGRQVITSMFSSMFKKEPEKSPPHAQPFSNVI